MAVFLVPDLGFCAVVTQKLGYTGDPFVGRAVRRGFAVLIDGVDVATQFKREFDSFEGLLLRSRVFIGRTRSDAGGYHQRRGAIGGGDEGIGSEFDEQAHHFCVACTGGQEERRGTFGVQAGEADTAALCGTCVDIGTFGDEVADDFQAVQVAGAFGGGVIAADARLSNVADDVEGRPAIGTCVGVGTGLEKL